MKKSVYMEGKRFLDVGYDSQCWTGSEGKKVMRNYCQILSSGKTLLLLLCKGWIRKGTRLKERRWVRVL